jgi:hypothetical protein
MELAPLKFWWMELAPLKFWWMELAPLKFWWMELAPLKSLITSFTKLQCIVTRTTIPLRIPALLDTRVKNKPSGNAVSTKKLASPYKGCGRKTLRFSIYRDLKNRQGFLPHPVFLKNMTSLSVGLLMIGQVYSVSCRNVYRWVKANCCFMKETSK